MTYITAASMLAVSAGGLAAFAVALLYWLNHRDALREITAEWTRSGPASPSLKGRMASCAWRIR